MANYGPGKILTLRYLLFLQENGAYLDYCICAMCRIPHYVKGFDCNKAPRSIVREKKGIVTVITQRRNLVQNISFFYICRPYYCDYTLEEHCYVMLIKKDFKLFNSFVMFVYTKPTIATDSTPNSTDAKKL